MPSSAVQNSYDLVVIGGGITGAGVARDAALRGLSCLLLEQGDFSSGTSSRTTRLVHGGLRYLESGNLHLVVESLRERDLLLRMAPHLIHPIPILLPVYRGDRRKKWMVRAGLLLYDILSLGKGTPHYTVLEPRSALRKAPLLARDQLVAAGMFYDYQIPLPERLVLENIFCAREHGARCLNYHEVMRVEEQSGGFLLTAQDRVSGEKTQVRATVVVNATGPWADQLGTRYREGLSRKVNPTKGVHLVVDADLDHAVFSGSTRDQRLFFTLPLEGMTLVGTTDTPWQGDPGRAEVDPEDVEYLLEGLRKLLPGRSFQRGDVLWSYAGLRPLAVQKGAKEPSSLSRNHVLHREGRGGRFLTIVGGKYTTFRKMAEETVDAACTALNRKISCTTDRVPLVGGGMKDRLIFREDVCECTDRIPNLPRTTVDHLVGLYGRRCRELIELLCEHPDLRNPIADGYRDCRAQVVHAVRHEDAHTLQDVILRRLHMGISPDRGLSGAAEVASLMARERGWSEATRREQLEAFREEVTASAFPGAA